MGQYFKLIRTCITEFLDDDCLSSGAAIAYYTIFSLPPLLVMVLALTNALGFSKADVDRIVFQELGLPENQIRMDDPALSSTGGASDPSRETEAFRFNLGDLGTLSTVLGVGMLIFSASAIFGELQYALNKVWRVAPAPDQDVFKTFIFKRLLSAGMLLAFWFVLLVSLILSAGTREVLRLLWGTSPGVVGQTVGLIVNELTTCAVATLLFASIFKILPDAHMRWRDVWVGSFVTAVLFIIGKIVIAWYLRSFEVGLSWGSSAASIAAALVWVYYSSLIVLFGAEVTEVWAKQFGAGSAPVEGAVKTTDKNPHRPTADAAYP